MRLSVRATRPDPRSKRLNSINRWTSTDIKNHSGALNEKHGFLKNMDLSKTLFNIEPRPFS